MRGYDGSMAEQAALLAGLAVADMLTEWKQEESLSGMYIALGAFPCACCTYTGC